MYIAGQNGFPGVPRLKILIDDADRIDEMLDELACALEDIDVNEFDEEYCEDDCNA